MIDIHCHILPEIDDGAKNLEVALEMVGIAYQTGIDTIVATPHFIQGEVEIDVDKIMEKVEKLNSIISGLGYNLKVLPGEEIFITPEIVELVESGKVLTLNNEGEYILIELPLSHIPLYTNDVIYKLLLKGITSIIAHPERNGDIIRDNKKALELVEAGALLQVNAPSLRGVFGSSVKATAWKLLSMDVVHFIATDAHTNGQRRPLILVSEIPTSSLNILTQDNPLKLLNHCKNISPVKVELSKKHNGKKKGFSYYLKKFINANA